MQRYIFALFWLAITGRSVWRALERGDRKGAIVPAILLLFGVWVLLSKARKQQDSTYIPDEGDARGSATADEPWEQGDRTVGMGGGRGGGARLPSRGGSRRRGSMNLACPTCGADTPRRSVSRRGHVDCEYCGTGFDVYANG